MNAVLKMSIKTIYFFTSYAKIYRHLFIYIIFVLSTLNVFICITLNTILAVHENPVWGRREPGELFEELKSMYI